MSVRVAEPPAMMRPSPVWPLVMLLLSLFWAMLYFDRHRGWWFDSQVYLPYNSIDEVRSIWPHDDGLDRLIQGQKLFHENCAICHQDSGIGNPANGCPPLDGSEWVAAAGPGRLIRIVSKGLVGPITVKGQTYGNGVMGAIGDQLPGNEKERAERIAAILTYIRKGFGRNAGEVTPQQVERVREKIRDHGGSFTAAELGNISEND